MKHLILKPATTNHQKVLLIGFAILFFALGGIYFLLFIFWVFGLIEDTEIHTMDLVIALLFPTSLLLFCIALMREGLSLSPSHLFQSRFLFGKKVKSTEVDIAGMSDICILRFNMSQKLAMGAAPNPDQAVGFEEFRICLLNENHSKRRLVFTSKRQEQAKHIVEELKTNFGLSYTAYNPPKSKKRKR